MAVGRGVMPATCRPDRAPVAGQKTAAANCPYALFDMRFDDDDHWRARLRSAGPWAYRSPTRPPVPEEAATLDFVRVALFFAWHVSSAAKLAPQLLLGMHEDTAAAFRGATIDCLPSLAATEAADLTARWNGCARYWCALAGAASRPNPGDCAASSSTVCSWRPPRALAEAPAAPPAGRRLPELRGLHPRFRLRGSYASPLPRRLTKVYKNGIMALKGIDLDVAEGDFFALLGPNGAGKTTAIGIVTSLVNKTSGVVEVFGHDIDRELEAAKSCIGIVPQETNFNMFEPVQTIVVNQAGFYGIPRALAKQRAEKYLKQLSCGIAAIRSRVRFPEA